MSEQDYQKNIQSLIIKMLEKPKNLFQETQEYWSSISSGYYDFEQGKKIFSLFEFGH